MNLKRRLILLLLYRHLLHLRGGEGEGGGGGGEEAGEEEGEEGEPALSEILLLHMHLDYFTCIYSAFRFASWWFYPGGLIKAEFEFNMLCMLYMPCLCSQVIVWV